MGTYEQILVATAFMVLMWTASKYLAGWLKVVEDNDFANLLFAIANTTVALLCVSAWFVVAVKLAVRYFDI